MKEWIVRDTLNNKYVQELIRCKDCRHFEPDGVYTMCYRHNGLSQGADWFCADGERKENANPTSGSAVSIDDFYKQIKEEWNQLRQQKDADPRVLNFLVRLMEFVESID